jgi:hypothetical protein
MTDLTQSSKAAKQQSSKAAKQQSSKAAKQQSSKEGLYGTNHTANSIFNEGCVKIYEKPELEP